jgi:hypothetical protein
MNLGGEDDAARLMRGPRQDRLAEEILWGALVPKAPDKGRAR